MLLRQLMRVSRLLKLLLLLILSACLAEGSRGSNRNFLQVQQQQHEYRQTNEQQRQVILVDSSTASQNDKHPSRYYKADENRAPVTREAELQGTEYTNAGAESSQRKSALSDTRYKGMDDNTPRVQIVARKLDIHNTGPRSRYSGKVRTSHHSPSQASDKGQKTTFYDFGVIFSQFKDARTSLAGSDPAFALGSLFTEQGLFPKTAT